jgi:hypothetical protein
MRSSSLFAGIAAGMLASVWCQPALGQWAVTAEVGADRFWGGSVENTAEHRSFRPYRPTTFGVGLERRAGRLGAGLRLRYASASLALEGADGVVAAKGVFTMYSAAPELVYRITSVGAANQLVLHGGPLFEIWSAIDEDAETRVGIQGAVSLNVPLGGRFGGSVMAGAALIPSPFNEAQLEPDFEPRALWRRRFAVGLDYRL